MRYTVIPADLGRPTEDRQLAVVTSLYFCSTTLRFR